MGVPAIVLIDGEHYPPVVRDALRHASETYELRAALFLGGSEKIERAGLGDRAEGLYGLPVMFAPGAVEDWPAGLEAAIETYRPTVVVDLSDEPVLGYVQRFRLASTSLARGVGYVGPDFHFSPTTSPHICAVPSLSIIGTGKRVGKTAVSGYVARALEAAVRGTAQGPGVVVVAMGRGGPGQPEVIDGRARRLTAEDLLAWSRQGKHAASDYFEDAALSGVVTVGCRRCGGGMAGEPFVSNVAEGVVLANGLRPRLIVLEGSGAAQPPVAADARLLVAGAHQALEETAGYLGTYRLLISDAVVLAMAEEPLASPGKVRAVRQAIGAVRERIPVVTVTFRPRPLESIEGRSVAVFSTAPVRQRETLKSYMEERCGCRVELFSTNLADREALRRDLESAAMGRVDTVVSEIKAAAIDTVVEMSAVRGLPVVFTDNVPVEVGPDGGLREGSETLSGLAQELAELARERFEQQR